LATNVLASLGVTGHAKTLLESVLSLAYACSSIRGTSTQKYLAKDKVCDVITTMGHLLGKAHATEQPTNSQINYTPDYISVTTFSGYDWFHTRMR
jgi:hypothetical protein